MLMRVIYIQYLYILTDIYMYIYIYVWEFGDRNMIILNFERIDMCGHCMWPQALWSLFAAKEITWIYCMDTIIEWTQHLLELSCGSFHAHMISISHLWSWLGSYLHSSWKKEKTSFCLPGVHPKAYLSTLVGSKFDKSLMIEGLFDAH